MSMQKILVIASTNRHKVKEFQNLFPKDSQIKVLGLTDLVDNPETVEETSDTYAGNAYIKADYWFHRLQVPILSDDSGLEVECLDGWPGVISARIATSDKDCRELVISRLMQEGYFGLGGKVEASARFVCVLCLRAQGQTRYFEGILPGKIRQIESGNRGFGYDPIFYLRDGFSLADRSTQDKNEVSHRAKAVRAFLACLKTDSLI